MGWGSGLKEDLPNSSGSWLEFQPMTLSVWVKRLICNYWATTSWQAYDSATSLTAMQCVYHVNITCSAPWDHSTSPMLQVISDNAFSLPLSSGKVATFGSHKVAGIEATLPMTLIQHYNDTQWHWYRIECHWYHISCIFPQHWKWHWLNIVLIIGKDRTLRSILVKSWLREARGKAVSTKTGGSSAQWC